MDKARDIHEGQNNAYSILGFWLENLKERDHLEDLAVDGRIILNCPCRSRRGGLVLY
jgi:hypothetical protein